MNAQGYPSATADAVSSLYPIGGLSEREVPREC
jgi:hypothetical protein